MARTSLEEDIVDIIDPDIATESVEEEAAGFKMAAGMSFPVPKKFGMMWKKRIDDALKVYEMEHSLWDDVFRRYRETGTSDTLKDTIANDYKYRMQQSTDENLIRINIRTIMRSTYMRNPHLEFTSVDVEEDPLVEVLQRAADFLLNKKTFPGLDMKTKARRWILHAQLTNHGVVRLDFQDKQGSLDAALEQLEALEAKLKDSKDIDEIQKATAELQALYETMPLLERRGFRLTNVLPHKVVVDPDCTSIELEDAGWLAEFFDLDEDYITARYYEESEEEDAVIRLSDGKDVDKPATTERSDTEDSIIRLVTNDETDERRRYRKKNTVECCMIYDKTTRRKYLFRTDDWKAPLWSFEDDLKLSRFFQHFFMSFTETIDSIIQPGEASYITGHVDAINKINRKADQIRNAAFGALIYNKSKVDEEDVKILVQHLNNPTEFKAIGLKGKNLADNEKLKDVVEAFVPPAFDYQALFNSTALRSVIDRNFSISMVDRGEQFKANTTNDAVQYYQESQNRSNQQLVDSIEDSMESLAWSLSELIISKFSKEEIAELLGQTWAEQFTPMTVDEFNRKFRMVVASGSIEKPDTEFKKKEAVQVAQAIGQFAQSAPATALRVVMSMFERAFSIFSVRKDDWDMLKQEAAANLQKGISTNGPTAPQK